MQPGAETTAFDLARRARAGDEEAFRALFERYRARLAFLVRHRIGPGQQGRIEVDDVVQETFLAAWRDLPRFEYRAPGSFLRWLSGIALHRIADMAREAGRAKRDGGPRSGLTGHEPALSQTPSRILDQNERVQSLLRRLDALPGQYREIILLAKFEGLTTAEMAERLGKTKPQVALLLHRALKRLAEELE